MTFRFFYALEAGYNLLTGDKEIESPSKDEARAYMMAWIQNIFPDWKIYKLRLMSIH